MVQQHMSLTVVVVSCVASLNLDYEASSFLNPNYDLSQTK